MRRGRIGLRFLGALVCSLLPSSAGAVCNAIPAATDIHRGALGSLNRPFASPGDYVGVEVRKAICDRESEGFLLDAQSYVVTVLFTPPPGSNQGADAAPNAVVLTDSCAEIAAQTSACQTTLAAAGGSAVCRDVGPQQLFLRDEQTRAGIPRRELFFQFPDFVLPSGHTLSGPAKVVVTKKSESLQCGLATQSCRSAEQVDPDFVIACVDQIFELDGSCDESAGDVDPTFGHFTALPRPNDFAALCHVSSDAEKCEGPSSAPLLVTTDRAGNLLVPFDYSRVLAAPGAGGFPNARLGRLDTSFPAQITGPRLVSSHSPEGVLLPPVFTPLHATGNSGLALLGSLDAPRGVVRLARSACDAGEDAGSPCSGDGDCTGGTCVALFDFDGLYADDGRGPVLIGNYQLRAETPLQLSGVRETPQLFTAIVDQGGSPELRVVDKGTGDILSLGLGLARQAAGGFLTPIVAAEGDKVVAMVSEAREGASLNSDNDQTDAIVMAFQQGSTTDFLSGEDVTPQPPTSAFEREAVTLPILDRRALRIANGLAYYATIENLGGRDTRFWASQAAGGGPADGASRAARGADRPPFDAPWVIFESRATDLVSPARTNGFSEIWIRGISGNIGLASAGDLGVPPGPPPDGDAFAPDITPTGRFIGFESRSSTVLPAGQDTNGAFDVFFFDIDPDQNGVYANTPGEPLTLERVNLDQDGDPPASGLECPMPGGPVTWGSREIHISPDGRYVLFSSESQLAANDVNTASCGVFAGSIDFVRGVDVYLRDRLFGTTEAISIVDGTSDTHSSPIGSFLDVLGFPSSLPRTLGRRISENDGGRFVVFSSFDALAAEDVDPGCEDVYLRDRSAGRTILVSRPLDTAWDAGGCEGDTLHEISADGARVLFSSRNPGFLPLEHRSECPLEQSERTFDKCPISLLEYEVATGEIRFVAHGTDGKPAHLQDHVAFFIDQGDPLSTADDPDQPNPFVGLFSHSVELVEDDANGLMDLFVADKDTGFALRGLTAPAFSSIESLASAGNLAMCTQNPVAPGDNNGAVDVLLSYVDMTDPVNANEDLNLANGLNDGFFQVFDLRDAAASSTSLLGFLGGAVAPDGAIAFLRGERQGTENVSALHFFPGRSGGTGALLDESAVQAVRLSAFFGDAAMPVETRGDRVDPRQTVGISDTLIAAIAKQFGGGPNAVIWLRSNLTEPVDQTTWRASRVTVRGNVVIADQLESHPDYGSADLNFLTGAAGIIDSLGVIPDPDAYEPDVDTDDSVLSVHFIEGQTSSRPLLPLAVEEWVQGDEIAAFRTREAAQGANGGTDLNGDGDKNDAVLNVLDYDNDFTESRVPIVVPSRSSAVPCTFEVCDPSQPYRIKGRTVRFLTREQDEGRDLNDDFDVNDLVVQLFNLDSRTTRVIATVEPPAEEAAALAVDPLADPPFAGSLEDSSQIVVTRGVCVDTAMNRGPTCDTDADCLVDAGQTCAPELAAAGTADADSDGVPDALDNCPHVANPEQLDRDADGVGDADPELGILGCDVEVCGNGLPEGSEACDDGNLVNGDGCSAFCREAGCLGDVNLDGTVDAVDLDQMDDTAGCFPCSGTGCATQCDMNGDDRVNNRDVLTLQRDVEATPTRSCAPAPPVPSSTPGGGSVGGCGLGIELVPVLAGLLAWRRRRGSTPLRS